MTAHQVQAVFFGLLAIAGIALVVIEWGNPAGWVGTAMALVSVAAIVYLLRNPRPPRK